MYNSDTIVAPATPMIESSISVIRLSGGKAFEIIEKVFRKKSGKKIIISETASHTVHFGVINDGKDIIDEVLITVFKNPNSYTGEDVIEISSHGGVFITRKILSLLISEGARSAEPGEFTKRAFLNGKLDLSQSEAVADLIKSQTESAHRSSLKQLEGNLSKFISEARQDLLNTISLVELELDFAEEDVEFLKKDELKEKILKLKNKLEKILTTYITGKIIRDGVKLVISGKPNAGKSSLFNYLLNSERAIVSNIPGTTRDYLEEKLIINGVLFNVTDTAGIRITDDIIESEGVKRSYSKIEEADLNLYLIDSSEGKEEIEKSIEYYRNNFAPDKTIICFTKSDMKSNDVPEGYLSISLFDTESVENLKKAMTKNYLESVKIENSEDVILTNYRHKLCIEQTIDSLIKAIESIDSSMSGEYISLDLRNAINRLGEITGEFTNEEVLNNIFKNFCIGK